MTEKNLEGAALDAGQVLGDQETAAPASGTLMPPVDLAKEWAEIPAAIGMALQIPYPELAQVYTPGACLAWGQAMVPIAERYGWKPGKFFPWLTLAGATLSLALPTAQVMKAHQAALAGGDPGVPGGEPGEARATVTAIRPGPAMPVAADVELADPTQKNRPPRRPH